MPASRCRVSATSDGSVRQDCSEATAQLVDREVRQLLSDAWSQARDRLTSHSTALELVAADLIEEETIDDERSEQLVVSRSQPSE